MKIISEVSATLVEGKIVPSGTEFDMPTAQARVLLATGLYKRVVPPKPIVTPEGQGVEES